MKINNFPIRTFQLLTALVFGGIGHSLMAAGADIGTVTLTRTNFTPRYITNVIEIQMPKNIFVDEYRTNRINSWHTNVIARYFTNNMIVTLPQTNFVNHYQTNVTVVPRTNWQTVYLVRTNTMDLYQTNWSTRTLTNVLPVVLTQTNWVDRYQTNVTTVSMTNWHPVTLLRTNNVTFYQTNLSTRTVTNLIPVALAQTNFVTRYQTNTTTLLMTNWETVLLFKTNLVAKANTNLVEINVGAPVAISTNVVTVATNSIVAQVVPLPGSLTLEASATGKPVANEKLEVQMKFKADGPVPPLASLEWSAERAGGTMIFSGRGPEFKRELPFGTYKVEFIIRSESGRAVRARKTIEVNPDGVTQK